MINFNFYYIVISHGRCYCYNNKKNPKQTTVDSDDLFLYKVYKKVISNVGFSNLKPSFPVILNSSTLSGPVSVILCTIILSNSCDLSTFPILNDIQESCKQLVHEFNMKHLAESYYNYKINIASELNTVLDISEACISNTHTTLQKSTLYVDSKPW